jgi:CubicO group peptidase (beta-lactamase class C family)
VLVIRHGYLVFEQYRNGYDEISSHHLQSVTKSFTSTLIGIALQQGFLESVDQRVLDFYPDRELENPDPRKEQITLEHLLTMSPGMDWIELQVPYTDPSNSLGRMWRSRDVIQHVLDHPMLRDPGEAWSYNSGTSILLGDIVEQASGIDTLVFARQFLFDPLGFGATYWQETNDGRHYHTDGGLFMTPRDMARLGYLMLHDGVWEGERLLPEGWVEQATTAQYESYPGHGYAYQWWTIEGTDIFYASGHYDQAIFIIPEADMVVVFTANVPDEAIHPLEGFLFRYILGSCTDLPEGLLQGEISDYGFSFEYGLDFVPGILPFPGTEAVTPQAGAIQFSFINYPIEIFTVMWYEAFKGMEPEEALATASELLQHQPGLNSTWKESAELQIEDQEIALEVLDVETEGIFFTAFIGVWTCENAEQPFVLTFVTDASGPVESQLVRLRELLGSFSCAPSE